MSKPTVPKMTAAILKHIGVQANLLTLPMILKIARRLYLRDEIQRFTLEPTENGWEATIRDTNTTAVIYGQGALPRDAAMSALYQFFTAEDIKYEVDAT